MSLRLRLALAGAAAILLALGLTAAGLSQLFAAHVERRAVAEVSVQLDQVLAGLERDADGLRLARPPADPRFARPYGGQSVARARTAARAEGAACDPAQVADRLIAVLRRTPDSARLDWRQSIAPGHAVVLYEADLAEALGALAENAARHARSVVTLAAIRDGPRLHLTVTDDGPGIAPDQRDRLTARHARADESGTGLGLAIASQIVEAAGGALTLDDASPGLAATLTLPVARGRP